jgi:hypothetical protein
MKKKNEEKNPSMYGWRPSHYCCHAFDNAKKRPSHCSFPVLAFGLESCVMKRTFPGDR